MSKPRNKWWQYVKNMLRSYPDHVTQGERTAIESAIAETIGFVDGKDRIKIIDLVFFKREKSLTGAAMQVPCSIETAKKYHADFIRLVGEKRGLNQ